MELSVKGGQGDVKIIACTVVLEHARKGRGCDREAILTMSLPAKSQDKSDAWSRRIVPSDSLWLRLTYFHRALLPRDNDETHRGGWQITATNADSTVSLFHLDRAPLEIVFRFWGYLPVLYLFQRPVINLYTEIVCSTSQYEYKFSSLIYIHSMTSLDGLSPSVLSSESNRFLL